MCDKTYGILSTKPWYPGILLEFCHTVMECHVADLITWSPAPQRSMFPIINHIVRRNAWSGIQSHFYQARHSEDSRLLSGAGQGGVDCWHAPGLSTLNLVS